jgi:hypothetical protein
MSYVYIRQGSFSLLSCTLIFCIQGRPKEYLLCHADQLDGCIMREGLNGCNLVEVAFVSSLKL